MTELKMADINKEVDMAHDYMTFYNAGYLDGYAKGSRYTANKHRLWKQIWELAREAFKTRYLGKFKRISKKVLK